MYLDRISAARDDRPLIAVDALARQQWEVALATRDTESSDSAWLSKPFVSWSEWLGERWDSAVGRGLVARNRFRLDPHQTERLWQRVIDESDQGAALVETAGVARSARVARRSLLDAGVTPAGLPGSSWQDDGAAFLAWHRRFEACLEQNDWIDSDSVLFRLNRLPAGEVGQDIVFLDPPRFSAEQDRLLTRWQAAGFAVECLYPDDGDARLQGLTVADPGDELRRAANWALGHLESRQGTRVAVVVPDLESRRHEVESVFSEITGYRFVNTTGCPLRELPIFGAALDALRLLSGDNEFDALGRWLRSAFFTSTDADRIRIAAALEVSLRSDSRAQSCFRDAWRRFGLRAVFSSLLPDMAARIDTSLDRLPTRATPTGWTEAWQASLRTLGWQGFDLTVPDRQRRAWDSIWAKFAQLTPIVGILSEPAALEALERVAAAESVYEPVRSDRVLLLTSIDQVGPGFDGAWILGMTDDALPQLPPPNPLVPWHVQSANRLPGTDPRHETGIARQRLERLQRRVPEVILSCPLRISDQPQTPSPFVPDWHAVSRQDDGQGLTRRRIGARHWETVGDVPPRFGDSLIPGGTRTLSLQARCPVKAFCAARLGAEPLAVPARGIDSRLRGILIHRVLERLLAPGSQGTADCIDASIGAAFSELVRQGDTGWNAQIGAERSRISRLIVDFLRYEADRPEFRTIGVEQRIEIALGSVRVKGRIDRTDRLASGELILIDYKTGRSTVNHWFDERLRDVQLPAYAIEAGAAGILTVRFGGSGVEYRGAGRDSVSLPGRFETFGEEAWAAQISRWREQLTALVDEFVRGDVRVPQSAAEFVASGGDDHAGGAYAPVTRVGDPS